MKLSVVIVNYNVKYFLEQCLHSVFRALDRIEGEIFVVDNNSVDGSVEMVRQKFPSVKVISNSDNKGFSKANNQAISQSTGEYILLLNPDTVVEEDTFSKVLEFMDVHPDAGGLGVKMIDGSGKFLPESKRGLPTYDAAFYKIFGLAALFPKSKTFGKYHLGYMSDSEIHEVEILAGAFMLIRKSAMEKTGLLDEDFFMYGEDIDLSYRLIKAGYKNYYFPKTRIIHYKGESTKKSSVNYVFVFYQAMIIFANKHFTKSNASLFSFLIRLAIYFRAGAALVARFFERILLPLLDLTIIFSGIYFLKNYWGTNYSIQYPDVFLKIAVPIYCLVWTISIYFSGGYDLPIKPVRIVRGIFSGTLLILVVYALLPEDLRYSRALILLGTVWACTSLLTVRFILGLFLNKFSFAEKIRKRLLIVGREDEGNRVLSLLKLSETTHNFIGFVQPTSDERSSGLAEEYSKYYLGRTDRLRELVEVYSIDEIIFCGKDVSSQEIISFMSATSGINIEFKIAPPESLFIIGSSSIENPGELYIIDINSISNRINRRNKRVIDILLSIFFILTFPIVIFTQKSVSEFIKNIFSVLFGKISWVGYAGKSAKLPTIKKGVLNPLDKQESNIHDDLTINRLNSLYAKDYRVYTDLKIIQKGWKNLSRRASVK